MMKKIKTFTTDFGPAYGNTDYFFPEFFYHKILHAEFSRMRGFNLVITYERYDQRLDPRATLPFQRRIKGFKLNEQVNERFEYLGCSAIIPKSALNIFNGFEADRIFFYIEKLTSYRRVAL